MMLMVLQSRVLRWMLLRMQSGVGRLIWSVPFLGMLTAAWLVYYVAYRLTGK